MFRHDLTQGAPGPRTVWCAVSVAAVLSPDAAEAHAALRERRAPEFKGR